MVLGRSRRQVFRLLRSLRKAGAASLVSQASLRDADHRGLDPGRGQAELHRLSFAGLSRQAAPGGVARPHLAQDALTRVADAVVGGAEGAGIGAALERAAMPGRPT